MSELADPRDMRLIWIPRFALEILLKETKDKALLIPPMGNRAWRISAAIEVGERALKTKEANHNG